MDPLTVSAVVAALDKVLGSAAAEAGKSAWAGLVRLVRSAFPDRVEVTEAALALEPGGGAVSAQVAVPDQGAVSTHAAVIDLSARLVDLAQHDESFAAALRSWLDDARVLSIDGGATTNVIGDGATVRGNVVQGRDIGTISFG